MNKKNCDCESELSRSLEDDLEYLQKGLKKIAEVGITLENIRKNLEAFQKLKNEIEG